MSRSGASRRKHRKLAKRQAEERNATGMGIAGTGEQPTSVVPVVAQTQSPFMPPMISDESLAINEAAGKGSGVLKLRDQWEAIQAVNQNFPISREMMSRIVFDVFSIAQSPKTSTRDKLMAARVLASMAEKNDKRQLPTQVTINTGGGIDARALVRDVLDELNSDPQTIEALDYREYKVEPGSPDDYAE